MNPLNQPTQSISPMMDMYARYTRDPNAFINSLDPNVKNLLQMANGDPKAAFLNLCRTRGLDPSMVLKQLGLLQ